MNRVRTIFTGVAGTPWYSNLYFADDAVSSTASAQKADVGTFWSNWAGGLRTGIVATVQGDVARIDETNGALVGNWAFSNQVISCSGAGDNLPWATQGLLKMGTTDIVHNRRVRGRIFIPGLLESDNTGGVPAAGWVSTAQTIASAFLAATSGELVVWSRPFAGAPGNPARVGTKHIVTGISPWTQWATMRTRRD